MELNIVLYKVTLLLVFPLSRAYLLLVLGFSKGMNKPRAIANSFNQRNDSCIFVDIETNVDSSNMLMTTSDAVKLVIRGKLLAWIKYYMYLVRSEKNQPIKVKFQGRLYGTLGFGNGTPKSVPYRYICLT